MLRLGEQVLPWGGGDMVRAGKIRDEYIFALQEADNKRLNRLIEFAQSE